MEGDITYDPKEDWEGDSRGRPAMDFPVFFDAMFELADGEPDSTVVTLFVSLTDAKAPQLHSSAQPMH